MLETCIICRKPLIKLSDEHVFPTAIGGSRVIRKICIECNNKMGSNVDTTLTEHIIIRLFREKYGLAGQSGNIPSFFDQVVSINGDSDTPAKLKKAENGDCLLKLLPQTMQNDEQVIITIDLRDINKLESIKKTISDRQKKKGKKISFSDPVISTIKQPRIEGRLPEIDIINYKIGFLKIAYEFACDVLPRYFDDESAKEISEILFKRDISRLEKFVIRSEFSINEARFLKVFGDFKDNHTIHLIDNSECGFFCYVTVFDSIFVIVRLSMKNYCGGYNYMLYNNYIERTYWMKKFSEKGFKDI